MLTARSDVRNAKLDIFEKERVCATRFLGPEAVAHTGSRRNNSEIPVVSETSVVTDPQSSAIQSYVRTKQLELAATLAERKAASSRSRSQRKYILPNQRHSLHRTTQEDRSQMPPGRSRSNR